MHWDVFVRVDTRLDVFVRVCSLLPNKNLHLEWLGLECGRMDTQLPPGSFEVFGVVIDSWNLLTAMGAFAVGVLATLIRQRRSRIVWTAQHNTVATAAPDSSLGAIVVTRDGQPVQRLMISSVVARNDYARDFKDIVVRVSIRPEHGILKDEAVRGGASAPLAYTKRLQEFAADPIPHEPINWNSLREYTVPVWNRGEELRFGLLVDGPPPTGAHCRFDADIPGAKLVERDADADQIAGIPLGQAVVTGALAVGPVSYVIVAYVHHLAQPALLVLLGIFMGGIGARIVKAYHKIRAAIV